MNRSSRTQDIKRRAARKLKLFNLFGSKFERGDIDKATFLARAPETELMDDPPTGVSVAEMQSELARRTSAGQALATPTHAPTLTPVAIRAIAAATKPADAVGKPAAARSDIVVVTGHLSNPPAKRGG